MSDISSSAPLEPESDHGEVGFNWPLALVLMTLAVFWGCVFIRILR